MKTTKMLQQTWLVGLAKLVKASLLPLYNLKTIATYGFPEGRGDIDNVRGICYKGDAGANDVIFIHPAEWADARSVVVTFLHEAVHSIMAKGEGHGAFFQGACEEIGLRGDNRDTPNAELEVKIGEIIAVLPPLPSDPLSRQLSKRQPKQTCRMLLWVCSCGFKIRCAKETLLAGCWRCDSEFTLQEKGEKS